MEVKKIFHLYFLRFFKPPKKKPLINQIKQYLMYKKLVRKIILIIRLFIDFILRKLINTEKLKKLDKCVSLNKDEISIINKFVFEEQGISN